MNAGHEHSRGDRCVALHIDRDLYAEIASGASGSNDHAFRRATLPAAPSLAAITVSLQNPNPFRLALEGNRPRAHRRGSERSGRQPRVPRDGRALRRCAVFRASSSTLNRTCSGYGSGSRDSVRPGNDESLSLSSHVQARYGAHATSICPRSPTASGCGEDSKHRGTDRSRCGRSRIRRPVDFQSFVSWRDRRDADNLPTRTWKCLAIRERSQRPCRSEGCANA